MASEADGALAGAVSKKRAAAFHWNCYLAGEPVADLARSQMANGPRCRAESGNLASASGLSTRAFQDQESKTDGGRHDCKSTPTAATRAVKYLQYVQSGVAVSHFHLSRESCVSSAEILIKRIRYSPNIEHRSCPANARSKEPRIRQSGNPRGSHCHRWYGSPAARLLPSKNDARVDASSGARVSSRSPRIV